MRKFFTLNFNTYHPESKKASNKAVSLNDETLVKAPEHCVENIMNFARAYKVVSTESAGKAEMILN